MRRSTGCAAGLVSSQPAIPCVVTRDGPELYTRGDRSSNFIGPVPRSPFSAQIFSQWVCGSMPIDAPVLIDASLIIGSLSDRAAMKYYWTMSGLMVTATCGEWAKRNGWNSYVFLQRSCLSAPRKQAGESETYRRNSEAHRPVGPRERP